MPKLYHPELDREHSVSTERVAESYRRRGWIDAKKRRKKKATESPPTSPSDSGGLSHAPTTEGDKQ